MTKKELAGHPLNTAQEVFTFVKAHLLKQGGKSRHLGGACLYRSPEGLSCAVGCLIPDEDYLPTMEDCAAITVISLLGRTGLEMHVNLLYALQLIHDQREVQDWPKELARLAANEGLSNV